MMNSRFPTLRNFVTSSGSFRTWWPWYTTAVQRQSLLRLIAVATEQHLPLPALLENWMQDESGLQRRRLGKLVKLLQQGRSLADAADLVTGVLREEDILAIRFDAQSGTRTAAMRELLVDPPAAATHAAPRLQRALLYLCVLVPLGLLVVGFTQVQLVPKLGQIFQQFGMQPPPVLAWSLTPSGTPFSYAWLLALASIVAIYWLLATRSGRSLRQALFGRLLFPWHERRAAGVLQNIALVVEAGRPIPGALSTLARYHFDPAIRRELLYVRNEVEQGADIWHSLAGVDMLTPAEVHLLHNAERMDNLGWTLRTIVTAKERRTSRRIEWGVEFVVPAVVLVMAILVIFQALTVFQPLTRMIDAF